MAVDQTLPSTVYQEPVEDKKNVDDLHDHAHITQRSGPVVGGRNTTITTLLPRQLLQDPLLPSFMITCNAAYKETHIRTGILPADLPRLAKEDSILMTVGSSARCFTLVMHYEGTNDVIATVSLRPFAYMPLAEASKNPAGNTFERERVVPDDTEAWEIKLLCVLSELKGQGLAVLLMRLGEEEALRRYEKSSNLARRSGNVVPKHLLFVLSAIKEEYYEFYLRRGYQYDYEVSFPIGTLGSEKPFTIAHLSKPAIQIKD